MTDTSTTPLVGDPELAEDEPRVAHIVGPLYTDAGVVQGRTRVIEASFAGTPVEALCGALFVPTRDPEKFPVCEACKAIVERHGS